MRRTSNGFSMIEVLFAVFVLSIGLLGIAGLQIVAKRSNFEAIQRTTATMLANDIAERMRANPTALATYTADAEPVVDATGPAACIESAPCTTTQLAGRDLWEWHQAILGSTALDGSNAYGGLVRPSACIVQDPGDSNALTIAIAWRGQTRLTVDPNANACGADLTGDYGADLEYRRLLVLNTYIRP